MPTPTLLAFHPDFGSNANERLEWRTSVSIASDGTESRRSIWSVPRRIYEFELPEAPGFNQGLLAILRAQPAMVRVPLWCFSGNPATQGLTGPGQQFLHVGNTLEVADSPTPGAAFYEAVPLVDGYLHTEISASHWTDEVAACSIAVRAVPFVEQVPAWGHMHEGTTLARMPDWFIEGASALDETLSRNELLAESNTALFDIETRYVERKVAVTLALPDDEAVAQLRAFLFHVKGRHGEFAGNVGAAADGMRRWRLDADAIDITYQAGGWAECRLPLKDLGPA